MKYRACAQGAETELSLEREGLRYGSRFLDFADVAALRPVNHRVFLDTLAGETLEISMLGFSFDGFWEELTDLFGKRSLEALFVEEAQLMRCEGEYDIPRERGRGVIALYPDAVCVLPPSHRALRIPLCFTERISLEGYQLRFALRSGACCTVGKMGYDTHPFAERAQRQAALVKQQRAAARQALPLREPFTEKGLFRTQQLDTGWNAAFGDGVCALEFLTEEDAATYLYRFSEPKALFLIRLPEETIAAQPLSRMAVARSEALRFLRARSAGRLIHSANHAQRLREFLQGG